MLHLSRTDADGGAGTADEATFATLSALPVAVVAIDAGGGVLFANDAFAALAGAAPAPGSRLEAVLAGGVPRPGEPPGTLRLLRDAASPLPVEATAFVLPGTPGGAVSGPVGLVVRSLDAEHALAGLAADMERQAADALAEARAAEIRLRDLVETLPQAVCVFDAEDRYVLWNEAYAALYPEIAPHLEPGAAFVDILRISLASGEAPEQITDQEAWLVERLRKHALPASQEEQELRDGRWLRHDDRRTKDGGAIGLRIDITDLKRREASFRLLFDSNPVPMLLLETPSLAIAAANDAALAFYGRGRDEIRATTAAMLHVPAERETIADRLAHLAEPLAGQTIWHQLGPDGAERKVLLFSCALPDDGRRLQLVAVIDVTERARAEARIAHLAHHDPLTGLPNRIRFRETLDAAVAGHRALGTPVALHYIDLDGFKPVNDGLGHSGGDRVLERVAGRLRAIAAPGDLVARLGGDEFVLLQRDFRRTPASVADRLVAELAEPCLIDGVSVRIGASVGVAVVPPCFAGADALLREADAALYAAKAAGRGRWHLAQAFGAATPGSATAPSGPKGRKLSPESIAAFASAATDALVCIDGEGLISFWNDAATRLFGLEPAVAIGSSIDVIIPEPMRGGHAAGIARLAAGGSPRIVGRVVEVLARNVLTGETVPVEMSLARWDEDGETRYGAVLRDASERRRNEERLHQLAHFDQLTMLPNRTLLFERMAAVLGAGRPADLHFVDIVGLEEINDQHGEEVGDALLVDVGLRLRRAAVSAHSHATVARIGGDEFAILLPEVAPGADRRESLRAALSAPAMVAGRLIGIDVSIGSARAPEHGTQPSELFANAGLALERARAARSPRVADYDPALRRAIEARRSLTREFARAIENGEFEVFYQPQVRLADRRIVSAEALLRWRHPERGLVPPAGFIDALEASDFAVAAGTFVLREACSRAAAWRRLRPDFTVGVNLFEAQLAAPGFVEAVMAALVGAGLEPGGLEIELTEKVAVVDDPAFAARVAALRAAGVGVAFDDYGTGYASLGLLSAFPLSRLKIDRRFVSGADATGNGAAIVGVIVSLGHAFGLDIIAEGVETPEQADRLAAAGCGMAQGYLFGRPMPADEFAALLAAGAP